MANEIAIKSIIDLWHARIKEADALVDNLTDEQLQKEIAPGKNRGVYLLGHLTTVHDRMLPLMNFEERQYAKK